MIKGTIKIVQFVIKMVYLNNLDYDIRFLIESFSISFKYYHIIPEIWAWQFCFVLYYYES